MNKLYNYSGDPWGRLLLIYQQLFFTDICGQHFNSCQPILRNQKLVFFWDNQEVSGKISGCCSSSRFCSWYVCGTVWVVETHNFECELMVSVISKCVGWTSAVSMFAMGWTIWGGILVGVIFSTSTQTGPEAKPASCIMVTGSLTRGKAAGAWQRPTTPHLALRLKKE